MTNDSCFLSNCEGDSGWSDVVKKSKAKSKSAVSGPSSRQFEKYKRRQEKVEVEAEVEAEKVTVSRTIVSTHSFFFLLSRRTVQDIRDFLLRECNIFEEEIGPIRVFHDRDGKETNRTLLYLPTHKVKMVDSSEFKLEEYKFHDHLINRVGFSRNFYIPKPRIERTIEEIRDLVFEKLQIFFKSGALTEKDLTLTIPLKSRQFGTSHNAIFVLTAQDLPIELVATIRFALDFSPCSSNEKEHIRCLWARNRS